MQGRKAAQGTPSSHRLHSGGRFAARIVRLCSTIPCASMPSSALELNPVPDVSGMVAVPTCGSRTQPQRAAGALAAGAHLAGAGRAAALLL